MLTVRVFVVERRVREFLGEVIFLAGDLLDQGEEGGDAGADYDDVHFGSG